MPPHTGGAMSWNMSAAPQGSGPPAPMAMREPPQYSEFYILLKGKLSKEKNLCTVCK